MQHKSQHIFEGERLGAFSDAVFSIIATIMIIPLKITKEETDTTNGAPFDLSEYVASLKFGGGLLLYLYAYSLVIRFWYAHNRIFRLIKHVDDAITCLNLVILLVSSFLPAAILLTSYYPTDKTAITITSVCIIIIDLTMIVMLVYALRKKTLLHSELHTMGPALRLLKLAMFLPLVVGAVSAAITILLAQAIPHSFVGAIVFYTNGIASFGSRVVVWLITIRVKKRTNFLDDVGFFRMRLVSKERIIAFSDGVFAIVATLVVLDITTVDIPESIVDISESIGNENVSEIIKNNRYIFTTYIASFIIVGLLWFIHHSMFQFIEKATTLITVFNSYSLFYIGMIPFGAGAFGLFADGNNSSNEVVSIRVITAILVLASTSLLLLWSIIHCQKSKCLSSEIDKPSVELLQLCKLLIYPILGLVSYFVTFLSYITVHHFFAYAIYTSPILFIAPKLLMYMCMFIPCIKARKNSGDIQLPESSISNMRFGTIEATSDHNDREQHYLLGNYSRHSNHHTTVQKENQTELISNNPSPTDPSIA